MSKKLLLADDSITIQKVIGITFANEDYQLAIVDNGNDALEKAREFHPDLVLADVFMPGKNGYELCAAVKQDPTLKSVPVLLLSGTFEPFDEEKARDAGADGWIAKPFESQALIDRVEELIARVPESLPEVAEVPPPAAPVVDEPEVESDIWDELEELKEEVGEEFSSPELEQAEEPAAEAEEEAPSLEDDLWGEVSLDEEDLFGEEGELPSEEEQPWEEVSLEEVEEDLSPGTEEAPVPAEDEVPASVDEEESGWEEFGLTEDEEEILSLDESDILEEEALTGGEEPPAPPIAIEEPEPEFMEEEVAAADVLEELEEISWEEDQPLGEETDFGEEESTAELVSHSLPEEEIGPVEEEEPWPGLGEEAEASYVPEAPAVEEEAPALAASPVGPVAEEKAAALTEEELARIVEKVAGSVIERLAGSLLEKVVWEVVPDLAESMIREELRRIKEGAGQ
jgi:CheY-like chemotaxis protein